MTALESLRATLAQTAGNMSALVAAVQNENRAMTEEEDATFKKYDAEVKALEASIANMERVEELQTKLSAAQPRVVAPAPNPGTTSATPAPAAGATVITGGGQVAHNYANHGFTKGPGEYYLAVRAAAMGRFDPRLMQASVSTWAGETVGADGGFALPPQFTQGIMSLVMPYDSFLQAISPLPTQSDIITVPKDEDAPWSTSAITAAKTSEGTAITASKPAVKQLKVPMYGIKSLVHVDEKSLRDMAFLAAYVERKMGEKIRYKVENYVMNGTGDNEPLGIMNAPGKYAVTAAAGTSTSTSLSAYDVGLMEATALPGNGGFWIAHPLLKAQMRTLSMGTAGFPLMQSDWRGNQRIDTLLGYPYYSSVTCQVYNTEGDIIFMKPDGYLLAFEQAGPQNATTIAFAFDQNLQSFRTTLYMGGAPTLAGAVLLPDSTNYASNIVTLAGTRS